MMIETEFARRRAALRRFGMCPGCVRCLRYFLDLTQWDLLKWSMADLAVTVASIRAVISRLTT